MGSSSAEFSLFLGFGEQTVAKYEAGTLPDELHSNTMRMASTKEGAEMLFSLNGDRISKASRAKVRKCLGLEEGRPVRLAFHPLAASVPLLLCDTLQVGGSSLGNHAPRRLLHFQHVFIVYEPLPRTACRFRCCHGAIR